jgi:hypothetical protein
LFPVLAAPIVASNNADCGAGCSLDITILYSNKQELSDMPVSISEYLSSVTGLGDLVLTQIPRPAGVLRDIRHNHAHAAPEMEHADEAHGIFFAYFKLSTASRNCADLSNVELSSDDLAAKLAVSKVLSFFAVRSSCNSADEAKAAPIAIKGVASVVISDFEDGSSDKFAEIATAEGEVYVVGGPNSGDAVELSEWSAMKTAMKSRWKLTLRCLLLMRSPALSLPPPTRRRDSDTRTPTPSPAARSLPSASAPQP